MFNRHFFDTLLGIVETIENVNLQYACEYVVSDLASYEKHFFDKVYAKNEEDWWDAYFKDVRYKAYNSLWGISLVAEHGSDDKKTIWFLTDILLSYKYAPTYH